MGWDGAGLGWAGAGAALGWAGMAPGCRDCPSLGQPVAMVKAESYLHDSLAVRQHRWDSPPWGQTWMAKARSQPAA